MSAKPHTDPDRPGVAGFVSDGGGESRDYHEGYDDGRRSALDECAAHRRMLESIFLVANTCSDGQLFDCVKHAEATYLRNEGRS